MRKRPVWIGLLALAVVVVVGAAAQSVPEQSLQAMSTVGWLPAGLAVAFARPQTAGQYRRRLHRRSRW